MKQIVFYSWQSDLPNSTNRGFIQPNRTVVLRRSLDDILKKLDSLQPTPRSKGGTVADLIAAIHETQEPVAEFSKIADAIAVMNDADMPWSGYGSHVQTT